MHKLFVIFIGVLLVSCKGGSEANDNQDAKLCLEQAKTALAADSIRQGETLLRQAIRLAEASHDWHTAYISYQRLAEAISLSNPKESLKLIRKALDIYSQHPDDERNHIILLDYAGTYASQVAYTEDGPFTEALELTTRAYELAAKQQMSDLMCQTLTSLANIAWAMEDYKQALDYARQAEKLATAELLPGTLQVLARSYLSLNMLDSAEVVYRQIESGDDAHLAYIVQSSLAKIAVQRQGGAKIGAAIDEAFEQIEDFYFMALQQKDDYYQETLRQETENQRLTYRSLIARRTYLIIIVALLLVILSAVLVIRYRLRMMHQRRTYEEAEHQHAIQMQEQEKKQLQREVENQKFQLYQAGEVALFLQNYILEHTEVIKKLDQSNETRIFLNPREWGEVERTLNAISGNCIANLRKKYPKMQEDDIRLCILTRLGLSNRAIGNIYSITISAVQHRKLKLKKDVFGENNPDVTLEQILTNKMI